MAYNKAWEEKKWRQWKEAEEKKLRRLGVSEDVIARLRESDWDAFKAERRYFERLNETDTYIDWQAADEAPPDIRTVQNLLDEIDNEELYRILLTVDKLTLQIAVLKMEGYTNIEIAKITDIPANAVNVRIWRLKHIPIAIAKSMSHVSGRATMSGGTNRKQGHIFDFACLSVIPPDERSTSGYKYRASSRYGDNRQWGDTPVQSQPRTGGITQ